MCYNMKIRNCIYIFVFAVLYWVLGNFACGQSPTEPPTPPTPTLEENTTTPLPNFEIRGIWYDTDSRGFYRFEDETDFTFETPEGKVYKGTYKELERDKDGNRQFSGKLKLGEDGEEVNIFIRFNNNGKQGVFQQKCMKYPFHRNTQI